MTKKSTRSEQKQPKMADWITPQEASLEMSIRPKGNAYVSPDDIKQLRLNGKLSEKSYMQVSRRLTLYLRKDMRELDKFQKRETGDETFDPNIVATWLEVFPKTIQQLEATGRTIPHKSEAMRIVQERLGTPSKATGGRKPRTQEDNPDIPANEAA